MASAQTSTPGDLRSDQTPGKDGGWLQSHFAEIDREALWRMGKLPVLKRTFGFISILGFSTATLVVWETVFMAGLQFGLPNGGPTGIIYQYLFVWLGVMVSFSTISEMASMAPTSSGQFHWVSMLAPYSVHDFLSYVTGWLTMCGWQATAASGAYTAASVIEGMAVVANPNYTPQPWHLVLITWAVTAFAVCVNVRGGTVLPKFEASMLLLHVFGYIAVMIILLTLAPKRDASFVFNNFINTGDFPTQGLSFMVGIVGFLWTFVGADGAIHMSEEIENAPVVVPRSILTAYSINGVAGFGMLIAALFCIQDVDAALSSPTGYAFIQIFQTATESTGGTVVMVALIAVMEITCVTTTLASASRQLWAFSRDHGVPGWKLTSSVEKRTSVPLYSVGMTALVSVFLSLINFGSSSVFENLVSLTVSGLFSSYLLATGLLLYRRLTGGIKLFNDSEKELSNIAGRHLNWGPWHIPGLLGVLVNILTCCFLATAWFFSYWPASMEVTPSSMNYNCLLWGAVVLFSLIYYFVQGRKEYSGPIIETDDMQRFLSYEAPSTRDRSGTDFSHFSST